MMMAQHQELLIYLNALTTNKLSKRTGEFWNPKYDKNVVGLEFGQM
jgi:hypothetical protein